MHSEFLMGNEAIALGALSAGVNVVAGYPGTPSTEVLETIAKNRGESTYVEWSVNEKAAMELVAGAAYSGARSLVTMKQVGLNVASDPLMSLEYVGVKGGLVILVADDPGPISSQTEQDTRSFARFSKVPCFDPSSAEEAYWMVREAFELSEKYNTPVFLRPTTRVCHGYASLCVLDKEEYTVHQPEGFVKDSKRWVIFPRLSYANHIKIEERNAELSKEFSENERNSVREFSAETTAETVGIAASGISYAYALEAMEELEKAGKLTKNVKLFKVSTPFPFPMEKAAEFLRSVTEVICFEELDPYIEDELAICAGRNGIVVKINGKHTGDSPLAGENTIDSVSKAITKFLRIEKECSGESVADKAADMDCAADTDNTTDTNSTTEKGTVAPQLPVRPPVLCAGCPHRASFYAVKVAMKGKKSLFAGDIGCYTLGNAMPLDMVDTCLCMGAGVNITQGVGKVEPDTNCFAFVGDSTFFASAITGVVNAVYNQANMTLVVLDNSTTAMTGHQPHPGTGATMMGEVVAKINMESVLRGIGLTVVETVNPMEHEKAVEVVRRVAAEPGVKAIIFKYPCIAVDCEITRELRKNGPCMVDDKKCINCKKCIREIGCPAIILKDGKVAIDETLCTGCGLCTAICPVGAIGHGTK